MNLRFMRMIVFFDLPSATLGERKIYAGFRKFLLKNGFVMMQESVYCRLLLNAGNQSFLEEKLRNAAPEKGLVQILTITEKQFASIQCITGEYRSDVLSSTQRTVIL